MATVIESFLVGIGIQPDEAGAKKVEGNLDSIRSSALKLGAVVGTGLGLKALTIDFAESADRMGKFSEFIGINIEDLDRLGFAIRREGGEVSQLENELRSLDRFTAGLRVGDTGFLAAAEAAGIQTDALIKAKNPFEAYLALADQFQNLDRKQRVNAAEALGLGDASVRLLSLGRKGIQDYLDEADRYGTRTKEAAQIAKEFNDSLTNTGRIFGSVGDTISTNFLPFLTNANNEFNEFLANNKEFIDSGIEEAAEGFSGSLTGISASIAALVASSGLKEVGGLLSKLGLSGTGGLTSKIGAVAGRAGAVGLAGSVGFGIGSLISDELDPETNATVGRSIARTLAFFGNEEAQRSLKAEAKLATLQRREGKTTINFNPQQSDINTIRRVVNQEITNTTTQAQQDIITSTEG